MTTLHSFNSHYPGQPRSAGTRMSSFWILLELRMTEVVVITGATRRAKLQSNRRHQQNNIKPFTDWMPFLQSNQQCRSTEGKSYHILQICSPQAHPGGLPTLLLTARLLITLGNSCQAYHQPVAASCSSNRLPTILKLIVFKFVFQKTSEELFLCVCLLPAESAALLTLIYSRACYSIGVHYECCCYC